MTTTTPLNATQAVFERILARPVAAPDTQHHRLVHIQWQATQQAGRIVQVYVNDELTHWTPSPTDREAWLLIDARHHQQIELLAVDPRDAATPSRHLLAGVEPAVSPRASVRVLRDVSLPVEAQLEARMAGQAIATTPLFAADSPRGGFGAVFGEGGFGLDAAIGPGLGFGQLGYGPLGSDGDALTWQNSTLDAGQHILELSLLDAQGNRLADTIEVDLTIARLPEPVSNVKFSPDLLLTWN